MVLEIFSAYSFTETDCFVCCRMTLEGKDQQRAVTMCERFADSLLWGLVLSSAKLWQEVL